MIVVCHLRRLRRFDFPTLRVCNTAMSSVSAEPCPFLTADLPGVGGVIKRYNEDFFVEEVPLYEASGKGTHHYITIEKNGLTTMQAAQIVARALGANPREVGYAGLKDAHAVTRQTISIEHVDPDAIERLDLGRIDIVSVSRHTNKLKLGHLRGNRFAIRVRELPSDLEVAVARARAIMTVLSRRGVPNYFGPQRFGVRGDNAGIGRALLRNDYDEALARMCGRAIASDGPDVRAAREAFDRGDYAASAEAWPGAFPEQRRACLAMKKARGDAKRAWGSVDKKLARLFVSATQSELFNRVLAARIDGLDTLQNGDVAWKHANGAAFLVADAAVEQPRCDAFEISPSGPLFGHRMKEAGGAPGELEARVLSEAGLSAADLSGHRRVQGARRSLRFPPAECHLTSGTDARGPFLEARFMLEPGCYATSVLRELTKT